MKKKLIPFLFIVTTLVSCSKFLDKLPESNATDGNAWEDETGANINIAGCYALTRASLNDAMAFYSYGDFPTDEFSGGIAGGDGWYANVSTAAWDMNVNATDVWVPMYKLRRYDNFYKTIDQVNRCLYFIPSIPQAKFSGSDPAAMKQSFIGEAYFLRAFTYFYMTRIWGEVPLLLERTTDVANAPAVAKAKQADILAQCLKDLQLAQDALSWDNPDKAVRANKGSVFALKAHIYAWMGDYPKCLASTDSIFKSNLYSYASRSGDQYLSIFRGESNEGIFEIAQSAANEGSGNNLGISFYTLKDPFLATRTTNTWMTLQSDLFTTGLFSDASDLRLQSAFSAVGTTDPFCIKYSNIEYKGTNKTSPVALNNIVVFRLADIALLRAEALVATSKPGEARTQLNDIRQKAGLSPSAATDADLFKAIIDERGRELFLEGHRFYDLVRLGRKTGTIGFGVTAAGSERINAVDFAAGKYYWPFDPTLILSNRLLTQTEFWKSRM